MKAEELCHLIERGLFERIIPPALCLSLLIMLMASVGCAAPQTPAAPVYEAVRFALAGKDVMAAPENHVSGRSILVLSNKPEVLQAKTKVLRTTSEWGLDRSTIIGGINYTIVEDLPKDIDRAEVERDPNLTSGEREGFILADSIDGLAPVDQQRIAQEGDTIVYLDKDGNIVKGALLDVQDANANVQPLTPNGRGQFTTVRANQAWVILPEDIQVLESLMSYQ